MDDEEYTEEDRQEVIERAILMFFVDLRPRRKGPDDRVGALRLLQSRLGALGLTGAEMDAAVTRAVGIAALVAELTQQPAPGALI
jgi:hypothetical protein